MDVTLTAEETEFLVASLEKDLGELREEVYHAEVSEFKDELKQEERIVRAILTKLGKAA